MKQLSKVVWSEGMHLEPHHFQVQSRFFEEITHFGISKLWFEPYGIVGLELDAEALRNGTVCLVHARGIFRDGLAFNMPESDPLPAPRSIVELFPPTRESLTVLLAIPPLRLGAPNVALTDQDLNGPRRLIAEPDLIPDENTGLDEKSLKVGRKNIQIVLDTENAGDLETLPIARIRRDGSGNYVYDESFIPPCTQISASPTLMLLTRRLIEVLQEKAVNDDARRPGKGEISVRLFGAGDWPILVPACHQFQPRALAPSLHVEARASGGTLSRTRSPRGSTLHFLPGFSAPQSSPL